MRVTSDVGPWSITPEWVLDSDISDRAVRLYALLGRYADRNGESFPSRKTLADRLNCSLNSLDRAVKELVGCGALQVSGRKDPQGDPTSNLYRLIHVSPVGRGSPTGGEGGSPMGDDQNESQLERETTLAAAPRNGRTERPRNEIWDALATMFGEPSTPNNVKLRGKVCAELKAAGAHPDEILARGKRWPQHFENATLTETALVKHWDRLGRKPLRAGGRP